MLNWLRSKLINHRRAIYSYFDGQQVRKADPMVLHRSLMSHPEFDLATHPQLIDESPEDRDITLNATRDVFGVKAFDGLTGEGLTEEETINLLWGFVSYCNSKKKRTNPSPTSPPATDSKPPDLPPVASTTKPPSASGSISAEPKFDMPPA